MGAVWRASATCISASGPADDDQALALTLAQPAVPPDVEEESGGRRLHRQQQLWMDVMTPSDGDHDNVLE